MLISCTSPICTLTGTTPLLSLISLDLSTVVVRSPYFSWQLGMQENIWKGFTSQKILSPLVSSLILRFWKAVLLNRPQNAWLTMHLCRNACLNKSYVPSVNFLSISFHWQFYLQKQRTKVHPSFLRYQENFSIHWRIILYLGKDVRGRDAPAHTRIRVLSRQPSQRLHNTHLPSPQTWHSIINSKGGRSAKDSRKKWIHEGRWKWADLTKGIICGCHHLLNSSNLMPELH